MAKKNYTSERQDYMTPPDIYGQLLYLMEHSQGILQKHSYFDIDVCCSRHNIPACIHFLEGISNGLMEQWYGDCFMNPPFRYTKLWVEKAVKEVADSNKSKVKTQVFAILPADRLETKYYQKHILKNPNCAFAFLPNKIGFINPEDMEAAPKPSQKIMVVIFTNDARNMRDRWNTLCLFNTIAFKGGRFYES